MYRKAGTAKRGLISGFPNGTVGNFTNGTIGSQLVEP